MKGPIIVAILAFLLISCQESDAVSDFTGNEAVYALQQASTFAVSGTATFKEMKDGSTLILVQLE